MQNVRGQKFAGAGDVAVKHGLQQCEPLFFRITAVAAAAVVAQCPERGTAQNQPPGDLRQTAVATVRDDQRVKRLIHFERDDLALPGGGVAQPVAQRLQLGARQKVESVGERQRFDPAAAFEQFRNPLRLGAADRESAPRTLLDQSFRRQFSQRLAHRGPADAKLPRHPLFGQRRSAGTATVDNPLRQFQIGLFRQ